jgi:hypothetical protein
MINLKVAEVERILTVEMEGMISEADIDGAIDRLQATYPAVGVHLLGGERGGFCMLLDWEKLAGWGARRPSARSPARSSATQFARWR